MFEYAIVDMFPYEAQSKKHIVYSNKQFIKKEIGLVVLFNYNDTKVINKIIVDKKKAKEIKLYGYASKEGSVKYNYELSYKRALNVRKKLTNLTNQKVTIIPMGENCKQTKKSSNECRKVELVYIY